MFVRFVVKKNSISYLINPILDDPKEPSLVYTWQNVGVIDYNADTKLWLVQKLSADERVLDENGKPIINKAFKPDGNLNFKFLEL